MTKKRTKKKTHVADSEERLALVAFHLTSNKKPDVYTLLVYGGDDLPITTEGQIIFFTTPELAAPAYDISDARAKRLSPPKKTVELVCDLWRTLYTIEKKNIDRTATIINCLNTLFDLHKAISLQLPAEYKRMLYGFADHLTFHRNFANYLESKDIARDGIRDAILWSVGAIVMHSRLVTE